MKKIINFSFVLFLICLIFITFYQKPKDVIILAKNNTLINNSLDEYINTNGVSISVEYYNNDEELMNLLRNGKYDLVLCPMTNEKELNYNKLIKKIDKSKIPNYRNIKEEYMIDSNNYIPLYIDNNELYGAFITSNNIKNLNVIDYLLKADVNASLIKDNNFICINWASEKFYL